jgi:hypothetical protein
VTPCDIDQDRKHKMAAAAGPEVVVSCFGISTLSEIDSEVQLLSVWRPVNRRFRCRSMTAVHNLLGAVLPEPNKFVADVAQHVSQFVRIVEFGHKPAD